MRKTSFGLLQWDDVKAVYTMPMYDPEVIMDAQTHEQFIELLQADTFSDVEDALTSPVLGAVSVCPKPPCGRRLPQSPSS